MKTNGTCKYQTLPAVMSNFNLKFKAAKQNTAKKNKTKKQTAVMWLPLNRRKVKLSLK